MRIFFDVPDCLLGTMSSLFITALKFWPVSSLSSVPFHFKIIYSFMDTMTDGTDGIRRNTHTHTQTHARTNVQRINYEEECLFINYDLTCLRVTVPRDRRMFHEVVLFRNPRMRVLRADFCPRVESVQLECPDS